MDFINKKLTCSLYFHNNFCMLKFLSIINLIVAVQALFLFLHFILKSKGTKVLNRLLALLCLCFTLILINTYISLNNFEARSILLQDIANNVMWFIGPSLYLYVIYNLKKPSKKVILLHLLPYLFPSIVDIFFNWQAFDTIIPIMGFTQMSIYLFLSLQFCFKNYKAEQQFYSWVLPSIIAFTLLVALNFCLTILRNFGIDVLPNTILQSFTSLLAIPIFYIAYKEMNSANTYGIQPKKYKTTPLSNEKSKDYLLRIKTAMDEEKLYRDTTLKLSRFAEKISIPSKYVSQVINQNLNLSFSDYLIQLRLEDAKKNLNNPSKQHLTIFGIAQESGFTSSSRFNYLFKKHTGLTPSQFQKQNKDF